MPSFNECICVVECIQYALSRSLSVEVSPTWRTFDTQRDTVCVQLIDTNGEVVEVTYLPTPK